MNIHLSSPLPWAERTAAPIEPGVYVIAKDHVVIYMGKSWGGDGLRSDRALLAARVCPWRSLQAGGPHPRGEQAAQASRFAERALTMPPEEAARQIVAAVQARRPRLVIGGVAKAADLLARLTPTRYWRVSERVARR